MPMVASERSARGPCGAPFLDAFQWIPARRDRHERSEWTTRENWEWEDHPKNLQLAEVFGHLEADATGDQLETEIERSRWILDLPENWDGEGAAAYGESTWLRAIAFLKHQSAHLRECGSELDIPNILPGPDGSVDLHLDKPDYELLINIPKDTQRRATFYGDDRVSLQIKGTLDTSTFNLGLIEWLVSRKRGR